MLVSYRCHKVAFDMFLQLSPAMFFSLRPFAAANCAILDKVQVPTVQCCPEVLGFPLDIEQEISRL